jgi:hypothetical protein
MDAFKFAFETTIVGLLAVPWLIGSVLLLSPPDGLPSTSDTSPLSRLLEPTPLGIVILTLSFFLGSAVLPLANQLLDDPDMPIKKIREIRAYALNHYRSWPESSSSLSNELLFLKLRHDFFNATDECLPKNNCQKEAFEPANDLFLFQEQILLKDGTDRGDRVNRLHEQVIVLRGAVFNGLVLVVICWYAYFSRPYNKPFMFIRSDRRLVLNTIMTAGMASTLVWIFFKFGRKDLMAHTLDDPPIMEFGLLFLGLIGFASLWNGVVKRPYLPALALSLALATLAYGAWWWTEFLYTREVIAAFAARL